MQQYILRRLLLFIPTLFLVSMMIFVMLRIVPGDPVLLILAGPDGEGAFSEEEYQAMRGAARLQRSDVHPVLQVGPGADYAGTGAALSRPMKGLRNIFKRRYPVTLQLALLSFLVISTVGIPIGVLAAVRQDTWIDYVFRGLAILGLAMPTFWLALLILFSLVPSGSTGYRLWNS